MLDFSCAEGAKNKAKKASAKKLMPLVGVSLKDLWKYSNTNGLRAASKAFILNYNTLYVLKNCTRFNWLLIYTI